MASMTFSLPVLPLSSGVQKPQPAVNYSLDEACWRSMFHFYSAGQLRGIHGLIQCLGTGRVPTKKDAKQITRAARVGRSWAFRHGMGIRFLALLVGRCRSWSPFATKDNHRRVGRSGSTALFAHTSPATFGIFSLPSSRTGTPGEDDAKKRLSPSSIPVLPCIPTPGTPSPKP